MNYDNIKILQPIEVGALYDDINNEFTEFGHEIAGWVLHNYAYIPPQYIEFVAGEKVTSLALSKQQMARTFTAHRIEVACHIARKYYDLADNPSRYMFDELDEIFIKDCVEWELRIGWWAGDTPTEFQHPYLSAIDICQTYKLPLSAAKDIYYNNFEPLSS